VTPEQMLDRAERELGRAGHDRSLTGAAALAAAWAAVAWVRWTITRAPEVPEPPERETQLDAYVEHAAEDHQGPRIGFRSITTDPRKDADHG